ncbi:RNA/ssDNA 5'-_3' exonuclease [Candidatus Nitrotoga sp. HW29]|uniref:3',5'-nucleoside bisphosphate phosphatase n=1 Tax=Candidatus Nitrotoga sp. HW29 TaxID=2886963 RepID=UPI001EF18AAE|nr:3',5'-nucleoside bisphosphate phosphatase [Candidatus Nitrotoga sp. HW29]CAH1905917.1 RNA/ssDNA 5'->3' exonuclease [Candidatus Nitrotoga sp. HW29]
MLDYDLHCHSTVSDGLLSPTDLVARAAERGVKFLALTDHDDLSGLAEAATAAAQHGMQFINGVEISVTWRSYTLHIIGLRIDPNYKPLAEGLSNIRSGRGARAQLMAESLARSGISGALAGAYQYADNDGIIGRTHFARFLVERGYCKDVRSVFKNYLIKDKPGYVPHQWASLSDAVGWICGSGGVAVLAHPGRYTLARKGMGQKTLRELLREFIDLGGQGIEVVCGSHTPEQYVEFARYANEFNLLASCGSDFHGPGESYRDLGRLPDFPLDCRPIWLAWETGLSLSSKTLLIPPEKEQGKAETFNR